MIFWRKKKEEKTEITGNYQNDSSSKDVSKKEIVLKVAEARQEDVYRGVVRIDAESMRSIGVRPGDVVEIEGKRKTVAVVEEIPPEDAGLGIVRMDGIIRRNAKVKLGDRVIIRKIEVKKAKKVVIAPARKGIYIEMAPELARQALLNVPLMIGDIIMLGGHRGGKSKLTDFPLEELFSTLEETLFLPGFTETRFIIVDTVPKGPVIVTEDTEVKVLSKYTPPRIKKVMPEKPVTFNDIIGLDKVKEELKNMVIAVLSGGISSSKGILLYGPPGCGKSMLIKALLFETSCEVIIRESVNLISKYQGETEKRIERLFKYAIKKSPTILVFENIDALIHKDCNPSFLSKIKEGFEKIKNKKVVVIATTSRPWVLDPTILSSSYLGVKIYIPPPDKHLRLKILKHFLSEYPLDSSIELNIIAEKTERYSVADLLSLIKESALQALLEKLGSIDKLEELTKNQRELKDILKENNVVISIKHIEKALEKIKPSITDELLEEYEKFRQKYQ